MTSRLPVLIMSLTLAGVRAADAAQAHDAKPQAPASAAATRGSNKPGAAAGDGHTAEPAAHDPPSKKTKAPTVSRVVAEPPASANDSHAPPKPSAPAGRPGYVSVGVQPRGGSASSAGKAKPMVSGLSGKAPKGHEAESQVAKAPAAHASATTGHTTATPAQLPATPATPSHGDAHAAPPSASDPAAAAPTSPPARPAARGPARLSDVHERIAAALASLKAGGRVPDGRPKGAPDDHDVAPQRPRRVTLRWSEPRWRVVWPLPPTTEAPHLEVPAPAGPSTPFVSPVSPSPKHD